MFRDEIAVVMQETLPDWMASAQGAHEQDDEIMPSQPFNWEEAGSPVLDEFSPPSYGEEAGVEEPFSPIGNDQADDPTGENASVGRVFEDIAATTIQAAQTGNSGGGSVIGE